MLTACTSAKPNASPHLEKKIKAAVKLNASVGKYLGFVSFATRAPHGLYARCPTAKRNRIRLTATHGVFTAPFHAQRVRFRHDAVQRQIPGPDLHTDDPTAVTRDVSMCGQPCIFPASLGRCTAQSSATCTANLRERMLAMLAACTRKRVRQHE